MTAPVLGVPLLFDYLYWLRDRILAAAEGLEGEAFSRTPTVHGRDLHATLAHEIDVEMSWLGRLRGQPPGTWGPEAEIRPEDVPTLVAVRERWATEEAALRAWLETIPPAALDEPVTVNELEGYPLSIYLAHVVEHGVTEMTSAAAILDQLGRPAGELGLLNALDDLAPMAPRGAAAP
jgi:uncharacterized damage-inducible protein DinB